MDIKERYLPSVTDFYLCCGAKIISSFSIFRDEPASWETREVWKTNRKNWIEATEKVLKDTDYYAIYVAILKDAQIPVNEQLLFKHGFRRVARGLNPVHSGSNNTLYVKCRTEGWEKEADQSDLDSFNPTPVHFDLSALVVEQEDTEDLKSPAKKLVGSNPTEGTKLVRDSSGKFVRKGPGWEGEERAI